MLLKISTNYCALLLKAQLFVIVSSTLSDEKKDRHTRREAGIQCHGWRASVM